MDQQPSGSDQQDDGSRLLGLVRAAAIKPADAKNIVAKYRGQLEDKGLSAQQIAEEVADKIIARYCGLAGLSGASTGLIGAVPGLGTIAAASLGATTDIVASMKLQVDMCMCMAAAFGYDIDSEDAQHLTYLIALGGSLEHAGKPIVTKLASEAGVRMLRQYLKGAALQAIKEFFKRLGIVFTRKALEKALPFGIGAVVGGGANYALTKYVGHQARKWFVIDAQTPKD